jgi:hypothetical protein
MQEPCLVNLPRRSIAAARLHHAQDIGGDEYASGHAQPALRWPGITRGGPHRLFK